MAIVGRDRANIAMQGTGLTSRVLRAYLDDPELNEVVDRRRYFKSNWAKPGRSDVSNSVYGDDTLGGYGMEVLPHGDQHLPLEQQIRGKPLPLIRAAIETGARHIVEVGHGNGDVTALLAREYPDRTFTGVDFSINFSKRYNDMDNVRWVEGYAAELLEQRKLDGDILFASSTLCMAGPAEVERYAAAIRAANYKTIILLDPVNCGWSPDRFPGRSIYLRSGMSGHDYRPVFERHGYRTTHFEISPFTDHRRKSLLHHQIVRLEQ